MELILIEPNSKEWNYMWDWVANHPINNGLDDPSTAINNGEAWQYMGSYMQDNKIIHQFRHREHPYNNKTQHLSLGGSDEFTQEQISKRYKI
jgi:hypothetical protein